MLSNMQVHTSCAVYMYEVRFGKHMYILWTGPDRVVMNTVWECAE